MKNKKEIQNMVSLILWTVWVFSGMLCLCSVFMGWGVTLISFLIFTTVWLPAFAFMYEASGFKR